MRFTLTVEIGDDDVQTGADLAELLVRIAPTFDRSAGTGLADCMGTVRDLDGRKVGNWTLIKPKVPEARSVSEPATTELAMPEPRSASESAATSNDTKHLTARAINEHLVVGSCYVNMGNERIRIGHARKADGHLLGKSLTRPGEWIVIPPDAAIELRE